MTYIDTLCNLFNPYLEQNQYYFMRKGVLPRDFNKDKSTLSDTNNDNDIWEVIGGLGAIIFIIVAVLAVLDRSEVLNLVNDENFWLLYIFSFIGFTIIVISCVIDRSGNYVAG